MADLAHRVFKDVFLPLHHVESLIFIIDCDVFIVGVAYSSPLLLILEAQAATASYFYTIRQKAEALVMRCLQGDTSDYRLQPKNPPYRNICPFCLTFGILTFI